MVNKKIYCVLISFLLILNCKSNKTINYTETVTPVPTPIEKSGWQLFWHDEFDENSLNTSYWTAENIKWPWSGEEEYYTDRSENLHFENGCLVITALKEEYNGAHYTSARIHTEGKVESVYGYIEARIKCPFGQGMWPAFWLFMPNSIYPSYYGEIDIMEMIGGGSDKDNKVYGTCHYGDGTQIISRGGATLIPWPQKLADDFHIYAVEWDSTTIKWYFDGNEYFSADITASNQEELRTEQYVIFNLAVGGTWPGSPDNTTIFPQHMYVDWVRWWKK
jgi:beta-glucanase (GH16 family)